MESADTPDLAEDLSSTLVLAGYVPMAPVGFALPHYGLRRMPNQWYAATCTPAGDPDGAITGFWPVDFPDVVSLPAEQTRDVSIGDSWLDIFLWNGRAYIGTRADLWAALSPFHDDIAIQAPLSGVDLALGGDTQAMQKMTLAGKSFVARTYGISHAIDWQRQAARTRLLSRLEKLGLPSPTAFEVTDGRKPVLEIRGSMWEALSRQDLDKAVRAAMVTASEFGLAFELSHTPPRPTRLDSEVVRTIFAAESSLEAQGDTGSFELGPVPPKSILILTAGARAKRIARAAKALDWAPQDLDNFSNVIFRDAGPRWDDAGYVEIRSSDDELIASGYDAVVVLADDRLTTDRGRCGELVAHARSRCAEDGFVIVAPALPEDGPSLYLGGSHFFEDSDADLVLDTSLARSPFWGTTDRHSLERRIANLILTTAQCLLGIKVKSRLWRRGPAHQKFASLGLWSHDLQSVMDPAEGALMSEMRGPGAMKFRIDELIPLRSLNGRPAPQARLVVGGRPDPLGYFDAVRNYYVRRGIVREAEDLRQESDVPSPVLDALQAPFLAMSYAWSKGRVLLTAETPTIQALKIAQGHHWSLVRLTDTSGLRRLLKSDQRSTPIPTEVKLPPLKRFRANQRLAVRGVDPRDIARIPQADGELQNAVRSIRTLAQLSRRYYSPETAKSREDVLALPFAELHALSQQNPIAKDVLQRYRSTAKSAKRPGDLGVLWSPTRSRRYILEDGPLPTRILEIEPGVVPAQNYFMLEGDESIPCLFGSHLFSVWARLTRSRGSGWAQRLATSRTFETFPIIGPFNLTSTASGGRAMTFDRGGVLQSLAAKLRVLMARPKDIPVDMRTAYHLREEADNELLKIYGLRPYADELEIAALLLDLNQQMGEILPLGQDQES